MRYTVMWWTNTGDRLRYQTDDLDDALDWAKKRRTSENRTVKIGHCGDAIRHWSRTVTAKQNHWAKHSTAECAR